MVWAAAIVAAGLIASSQVNNLLLKKYSSGQIIRASLSIQCLIAIVLVAGTSFDSLGVYGTIACIFCYLCCQGFSFPNSSALSMAPFTKEAGSASALMGAIQMALGAAASALVGLLSNRTGLPMTGVMASCSIIAVAILLVGRRAIMYKCSTEDVEEQSFEMIERG